MPGAGAANVRGAPRYRETRRNFFNNINASGVKNEGEKERETPGLPDLFLQANLARTGF